MPLTHSDTATADATRPVVEYTPKVDKLLEHATALGFTEQDFADLALAAADQSGATEEEQERIADALAGRKPAESRSPASILSHGVL